MFNSYGDKRNIILAIGAMVLIYFLINLYSTGEILDTLLILPGLIIGLTIHEFSHAKMADRLGDPTPESQGRLTLNPFAHMDPVGTICLLLAGFGWGKPVQIDPTYFRNPQRDNMLVALAGPVSNMIIAFLSFLVFGISCAIFISTGALYATWAQIVLAVLQSAAYINLTLGIFNLLPFPPLDGSKILAYFLKGKARDFLWTLERYSAIILIILFMTELPSRLISPVINSLANWMIAIVSKILALVL